MSAKKGLCNKYKILLEFLPHGVLRWIIMYTCPVIHSIPKSAHFIYIYIYIYIYIWYFREFVYTHVIVTPARVKWGLELRPLCHFREIRGIPRDAGASSGRALFACRHRTWEPFARNLTSNLVKKYYIAIGRPRRPSWHPPRLPRVVQGLLKGTQKKSKVDPSRRKGGRKTFEGAQQITRL